MAEPLVSFVIPVFNSEKYIARCLHSIRNLRLTPGRCEIIILDNGSTDRSQQVMHDLGFDFQVLPQVNVSTLRNRGAAAAQSKYVAFVDSDVELTPHWLQNGLAAFTGPEVVATGCFPGVPENATWVQRTWDLHQRGRHCQGKPRPAAWLSSMNLLVRRDDFLAVSGFNEQLATSEDVDLGYRLGRRGTLLYNPAMEAVHWGEARDVRHFWRKEAWRGIGALQGVLSHGLRWDEAPSLGYPLYVLGAASLLGLGIILDVWFRQVLLMPLCLGLLLLPALLLALNTVRLTRRPGVMFPLFILYFVYGAARAYAMVKT